MKKHLFFILFSIASVCGFAQSGVEKSMQLTNIETETSNEEASELQVFEPKAIPIPDEYVAILKNNGDIINAGEKETNKDWYNSLIDDNPATYWDATTNTWVWQNMTTLKGTGLIIKLVPVDATIPYVLKIGSYADKHDSYPTAMRWFYKTSLNNNWIEGGTLDMSGVSAGGVFETNFNIQPEYTKLAFITVSNNGNVRIADWAGNYPNTVLASFQFYGPNPNKVTLTQESFKRRLYSQVLKDFKFEHTHGIVDKTFDNNFKAEDGWITNKEIWNEDGTLKAGTKVPGADLGVALPDFSYDAPVNNSNIVPVGGDRKRQPTTTILHDVYVIPGERVDLNPYTDITTTYAYLDDFYRFYDYVKDKAHEDVYFLFNPEAGAYNEYGIFGGPGLGYVFNDRNYGKLDWGLPTPMDMRGCGGVASFYRPADKEEIINEYIAADFSQSYFDDNFFNNLRKEDVLRFIDVENKTIHEPIINFRHVFHVIDGRTQADEMSKDRAANNAYVAKNRRHISARANNLLAIRLINAMPAEEGVKANFYYRKQDGTYTRMGKYDIETYRYENGETVGANLDGMFAPYEPSAYETPNIELESDLNPGGINTPAWIRPKMKLYRAVYCEGENAKEGKYLIRFIAKDPSGERILLEDGQPLILREIVVEFLSEKNASFKLESEGIPETHSEAYLEANFQSKSVVDFDKYAALSGTEFVFAEGNGERIKYPAPWMNSSYSFGYKHHLDFSVYTITSHADCVPYKASALAEGGEPYDRKYYSTGGKEKGFFYYANAAGDPGEMAKINIPALCIGSTLHVSAWVNNMSSSSQERANVVFNLIAVMKDGSEISINSFITGYVNPNQCGKWVHAYYSVTPDFNDIGSGFNLSEVERFQVVLENNSMNSNGADYAIDDIRIYVAKPVVLAQQLKPLCNGEKKTSQRIDLPLKTLLNSISKVLPGEGEEGEEITIYYTIFDKEKYDALMAEDKENGYTEAVFNGSVLKYGYNSEDKTSWGKLTFNTQLKANPEWKKDLEPNVASWHVVDGLDCISFNIEPNDEGLYPGKVYVAAIAIPSGKDEPTWVDFNISDICTKQAEFTVRGSNIIKVDGIVRTSESDLSVCENQFPTIQIDIVGIEAETGESKIVDSNPLIDWYRGTIEAFNNAKLGNVNLAEALMNFRRVYPEATSTDQEFKGNGEFNYTEDYKKVIDHFIDNGDLLFASYSYVSGAVRFPEGEKEVKCPIVAIPANREIDTTFDGHTYIICNEPAEVVITVDKRAPGLLDGFDGLTYPEGLQDVPIRLGLNQLKNDMFVPLRDIYIVTPQVTKLTKAEDTGIYVVQTNDPAYRDLEDPEGDSAAGNGLRKVGEVNAITTTKTDKRGNARVKLDNDFGLKEGYFYTLRFNYMEDPEGDLTPDDVCDGQTIFTIKVVAEYQMWTGDVDGSLNFNNDGNWRRVTRDELLAGPDKDERFVTDGANKREFSYSPLGFTKVIIPAGTKYPHLFEPGKSETFRVFDGKDEFNYVHATGLSDNETAGAATRDIEYDLTTEEIEDTLYCRPWYANTCEQIHFLTNAEIMNQQHLNYEKAWVDMEMAPARWYTAASPLQGVVAGDMYLPTDGARQLTELFQPITFDKGINDRFAPAVYQRGWDRGEANVYELPSASPDEITNVAVALDWSNVYNDVQERYSAGKGYSVKTDLTELKGNTPDYVRFRLPKDDAGYEYWTQDGLDHGTENGGKIDRTGAYRLNPVEAEITLTNRNAGKYFLAGNPFMAHIDMVKFMEANAGVIQPKYWIMNGDSQTSAVMDPASNGFVGTVENPNALPPMQGFFVEALNAATEITLKFTPDMLTTVPWTGEADKPQIQLMSRGAVQLPQLMISARDENADYDESKALLRLSDTAQRGYADSEDALMLDSRDSRGARVYTIAGNRAVSVNATDDAEGVEIGVIADDDATTLLRFDNVGAFGSLSLHDRLTGTTVPLSEGMEYEVQGRASGRLFLTSAIEVPVENSLQLTVDVKGSDVVATSFSSDAEVDLFVYDVSGKTVATMLGGIGEARVSNLERGFYIVVARSSDNAKCRRKIVIR